METTCIIPSYKYKLAVPAGAFYTAVTRVKAIDKIFLRNFDDKHIKTDTRVKEQIQKLANKPYIFIEEIYESKNVLKIVKLSIN